MLDLGIVDGRRRRKTIYGQTEREVRDKLSTLRTAPERGIDLLAPSLTVGQWLDAWLAEIKRFDGTRPRTLTVYKGLAERYIKPVIGDVRLDKLTPAHVQRLVTETRNSQTSVVLPMLAVRYLQEHKKQQDVERRELGDAWREHGLVFPSSIGTPIEPRNVIRRWDVLRKKAGLDWLRLHDLRHGCATFLLAQGVSPCDHGSARPR